MSTSWIKDFWRWLRWGLKTMIISYAVGGMQCTDADIGVTRILYSDQNIYIISLYPIWLERRGYSENTFQHTWKFVLYIINLHITLKQFKYQKRNLYQLYLEDISILLIFHLDISFEYWEKFTLFMHTNYTIYEHIHLHILQYSTEDRF